MQLGGSWGFDTCGWRRAVDGMHGRAVVAAPDVTDWVRHADDAGAPSVCATDTSAPAFTTLRP